jgi:hypothetical protein
MTDALSQTLDEVLNIITNNKAEAASTLHKPKEVEVFLVTKSEHSKDCYLILLTYLVLRSVHLMLSRTQTAYSPTISWPFLLF